MAMGHVDYDDGRIAGFKGWNGSLRAASPVANKPAGLSHKAT